jgi:hypothetical protein
MMSKTLLFFSVNLVKLKMSLLRTNESTLQVSIYITSNQLIISHICSNHAHIIDQVPIACKYAIMHKRANKVVADPIHSIDQKDRPL